MSQDQWNAVERYFSEQLLPSDPALAAALESSAAAGLPSISVSPLQGGLLHILARAQGARRVLEIGTLGGYSAIWIARALPPDGRLVTLEADPKHAEVARANIARAGLDRIVEIRVGAALDTLPRIEAEGGDPFDLVFIDADKPSNSDYFRWALKLTRPGGLIIADNVVRDGTVLESASDDPSIAGTRRLIELIHAEPRVRATALPMVGLKGYDGLAIAVVLGDGAAPPRGGARR
jgi:predicted O-methyltransferase YrrM